jgi:hypothetical protein
MAIMATRSFPPGAISDAGAVCPNASPDKPVSNTIEKRIRRMRLSLKGAWNAILPAYDETKQTTPDEQI